MNYLGIDYGSAKIGLAKAESELRIATPLRVIANERAVVKALSDIIQQEAIDEIIVGYPFTLSGESGAQAALVDEFIKKIEAIGKPIQKQDERFSTRSAVSFGEDHASAAALILQTYLDSHAHNNQ